MYLLDGGDDEDDDEDGDDDDVLDVQGQGHQGKTRGLKHSLKNINKHVSLFYSSPRLTPTHTDSHRLTPTHTFTDTPKIIFNSP